MRVTIGASATFYHKILLLDILGLNSDGFSYIESQHWACVQVLIVCSPNVHFQAELESTYKKVDSVFSLHCNEDLPVRGMNRSNHTGN